MSIPLAQNFFKESVTTEWTSGAGNFYVSTKPTNDNGYLVLSPASSSLREIVKFTAVGTDGGGDYVTLTAANRGLGGTTDQSHSVGEDVYMNVVAEHLQDISDALDQIVAANAQYATESVIGISKMSVAPSNSLGTVTMTIASPAVFTFTSHGLVATDIVKFTTDGALPTGITANTRYYVIASGLTSNTFQVSATLDGTAVDTSGSQSGTHTLDDVTPIALVATDTRLPTQGENDALAGGGDFGTPATANKFLTEDWLTANPQASKASEVVPFTANGTWTKDAELAYIIVEIWGGGAGGHSDAGGGGGGGGSYNTIRIEAADLGSTETVTIAAAVAKAVTGNNSTFGAHITAYGGGRGADTSGSGGGGGELAKGTNGSTGTPGVGGAIGGGDGETAPDAKTIYGGGGGTDASPAGGKAVYGGGGGSRGGGGGTSIHGGDGGDTSVAGTAPAGGGGANAGGARGEVNVYEFYL